MIILILAIIVYALLGILVTDTVWYVLHWVTREDMDYRLHNVITVASLILWPVALVYILLHLLFDGMSINFGNFFKSKESK